MMSARVNPDFTLEDQGIIGLGHVYYNLVEPLLIEEALARKEGELGKGGAFLVSTGKFTGRSPKDKHVVKSTCLEDKVWWENTTAMSEEGFDILYDDMRNHMKGRDYFVQDLFAGAEPANRLDVRMVTELAWHGLFIRHVLRRPSADELVGFVADWTVINCPSFRGKSRACMIAGQKR